MLKKPKYESGITANEENHSQVPEEGENDEYDVVIKEIECNWFLRKKLKLGNIKQIFKRDMS